MEKFYIVTNREFLKKIEDYKGNVIAQKKFVKKFFKEKGICGTGYFIRGNGLVNKPFKKKDKAGIELFIESCSENDALFGGQLKKEQIFSDGSKLRSFRKNSSVLKEFQDLCIEEGIVINVMFHREGDYFNGHLLGGYSVTRFEYDGKYYLRIETDRDSIIPNCDGFEEIKGSEFYTEKEKYLEQEKDC